MRSPALRHPFPSAAPPIRSTAQRNFGDAQRNLTLPGRTLGRTQQVRSPAPPIRDAAPPIFGDAQRNFGRTLRSRTHQQPIRVVAHLRDVAPARTSGHESGEGDNGK